MSAKLDVQCRLFNMLLPLVTLVVFGVYLFFNVSAQVRGSVLTSLFANTTLQEASRNLTTAITPAPWTMLIWDLIHLWQAVWLFFVMGILYCYKRKVTFPYPIMIFFSIVMIHCAIWTVTFTNRNIIGSFIVILLVAVFSAILYIYSCYCVEAKMAHRTPHWMLVGLRAFLLNGLGLLASYALIFFFVSFDILLVFGTNASNVVSACTLLSFLAATIIVYFSIDMTKLGCIFNYVWTPYAVAIWLLAGIIDDYGAKGMSLQSPPAIVVIVLLVFVTVAFFFKIITTVKKLDCGAASCQRLYQSIQSGDISKDSCLQGVQVLKDHQEEASSYNYFAKETKQYKSPCKTVEQAAPHKGHSHHHHHQKQKAEPCKPTSTQGIKIQVSPEKGEKQVVTPKQDVEKPKQDVA